MKADKIVVMGTLPGAEGATIVDQGTYQDLVARGRDLTNILNDQVRSPMTLSETMVLVMPFVMSLSDCCILRKISCLYCFFVIVLQ